MCSLDTTLVDFDVAVDIIQIIAPHCFHGPAPEQTGYFARPCVDEGVVYFMRTARLQEPGGSVIAAWDIASDTILWERNSNGLVGETIEGMEVEGDWLYIVEGWGVTCINKRTGGANDSMSTGERWLHTAPVTGLDSWELKDLIHGDGYGMGTWLYEGKMYFTNSVHSNTPNYINIAKSDLRNIFCLDLASGRLVWSAMPPHPTASLGAKPVVANGKAYIPNDTGIRLYDANTGRLLGVDTSIPLSGIYNYGQFYEEKGYVIYVCYDENRNTNRLVAIEAE